MAERFPKNVAGDFYAERDCCISCRAPELEAPDLLGFDEDVGHCYFARQPETAGETDRAIRAVWASCCRALRYGGSDPDVLRRLGELGEHASCDDPRAGSIATVVRNIVTFRLDPPITIVEAPSAYLSRVVTDGIRATATFRVERVDRTDRRIAVEYSWYRRQFRTGVTIDALDMTDRSWRAEVAAANSVAARSNATTVHDILAAAPGVSEIRWFSAEEYARDPRDGRPTPY